MIFFLRTLNFWEFLYYFKSYVFAHFPLCFCELNFEPPIFCSVFVYICYFLICGIRNNMSEREIRFAAVLSVCIEIIYFEVHHASYQATLLNSPQPSGVLTSFISKVKRRLKITFWAVENQSRVVLQWGFEMALHFHWSHWSSPPCFPRQVQEPDSPECLVYANPGVPNGGLNSAGLCVLCNTVYSSDRLLSLLVC